MDEFLSQLTDAELLSLYSEVNSETKQHSFCLFSCYNARDVEVLVQLDKKFNLMQLVNTMAHENTVPFMAILGTVRYVETGITNRAHYQHNLIVTDKVIPDTENDKVEGAIVMTPRAGLHQWLGSVDLQSLYPRTIMALNMSIETFVGQFEDEERAWEGIRAQDQRDWMITLATGETMTLTGAQWLQVLRESNYAISAFGTVFDQNKPGMVADTLLYWFNERLRLQAEKKKYMKLADAETDPVKKAKYELLVEHYDLLQLTKKIQLNSAYGGLLNEAFRFGRREIGASVTGTGRQITKHMGQTIAEISTGAPWEFEKRFADFKNKDTRVGTFEDGAMYAKWLKNEDWDRLRNLPTEMQWTKKWSKELQKEVDIASGAIWFTECPNIIYGDTDSIFQDEVIKSSLGTMTAVELFNRSSWVRYDGKKEFANYVSDLYAWGYDPKSDSVSMQKVKEVYRHKVTKKKYTITLSNGKKTSVTSDHSLMVERNGVLIEIKPTDLQDGDVFLTAKLELQQRKNETAVAEAVIERATVSSIEVSDFEDEYVYDLVMEDVSRPYFFASDILVHNSCYFLTGMTNYEDAVKRADMIAEYTNKTFPDFLSSAFNCTGERRTYMKAQREIVAERGLFMFAKKKYTLKVVNLDGKDLREAPKQKSMGSEIKKADTPKVVQEFLKGLMRLVLGGEEYPEIEKFVNSHRGTMINADTDVLSLAPAKQVNNLDAYYAEFKRTEKIGGARAKLPGHVRAAINYNELIEMYDPEGALKPLKAGDKAAILYLRPNHLGIKSIGFPPDMLHLPEWFKNDFQVDLALTESKMIDSKIEGIFEALDQELPTPQNSFLNQTFSF